MTYCMCLLYTHAELYNIIMLIVLHAMYCMCSYIRTVYRETFEVQNFREFVPFTNKFSRMAI